MTTWIKLVNSMPSHPKLVMAGDRAAWLFVCGCCYSNEHLTDGFIARHVLPVVAPGVKRPEDLADRLVAAALWHEVEGGWQIHDYSDVQRSSEAIREQRRKDAERKAGVREISARTPRGQTPESAAESAVESARCPTGVPARDTHARGEERRVEENEEQVPQTERPPSKPADPQVLPSGVEGELALRAQSVLDVLAVIQAERGGSAPTLRGVGLAIRRFPDRDHLRVARELEHWALAGSGQRKQVRDWPRTFGTFLDGSQAGDPTRNGEGAARKDYSAYDRAAAAGGATQPNRADWR